MSLDINTKKAKKNAWRITKERGIGASRIRVPGGYLNADVLGMVQEIAKEYGNGYVHLTTRQGFDIGTSQGMLQVAEASTAAIMKQLALDENYQCHVYDFLF